MKEKLGMQQPRFADELPPSSCYLASGRNDVGVEGKSAALHKIGRRNVEDACIEKPVASLGNEKEIFKIKQKALKMSESLIYFTK